MIGGKGEHEHDSGVGDGGGEGGRANRAEAFHLNFCQIV